MNAPQTLEWIRQHLVNLKLVSAMEVLDEEDVYEVPVVVEGRLVGSLTRVRVLRTYRRALMGARS